MATISSDNKQDAKGAFVRSAANYRHWIRKGDDRFPAQANRYRLYISWACPWANRCATVIALKGLTKAIEICVVHPTWQRTRPDSETDLHCGWTFAKPNTAFSNTLGFGSNSVADSQEEPEFAFKFVRDLYERDGSEGAVYSVPLLWDKQAKCIVNNESSEIIRMLNSEFNDFAEKADLDLAPADLQPQMDQVDPWIYENINNGVYRCGFASSQKAYDEAIEKFVTHMDKLEALLASNPQNRFLFGDRLCLSDIRLFQTLVRNDEVYVVYFFTNVRKVSEYPHIMRYCANVWSIPEVRQTTHMDHIKMHYFTSHPRKNHFGIIPKGPDFIAQMEALL